MIRPRLAELRPDRARVGACRCPDSDSSSKARAPLAVLVEREPVPLGLVRRQRQRSAQAPAPASSAAILASNAAGRAAPDAAERDALAGQPLVGIVGAQRQPVLGARGEHAIGLGDAAGDQVVDHHAEIAFGAVEHDRARRRRRARAALSPATRPCAAASS